MKHTSDGRFPVQIRIGKGRRPSFAIVAPDEPTARARAAAMTEIARLLVKKGRLTEAPGALTLLASAGDDFDAVAEGTRTVCGEPVPEAKPKGYAGMTFLEFGEEWTSGRLYKRYRGMHKIRMKKAKQAADDQRRVEFVAKVVGPVLMADFSLDHFELVMSSIPDSADSDSSRRALAQVMSWLLKRAVSLRIRTDFPLPVGSLPTVESHREFQLLYPSEDRQLLACADVDLFDRAFYGFSVRNGCRKQNFLDLRWQDIDFDNAFCWVPDTKTGKPVHFDLEPGCVRALRALKAIADENFARAEDKPGAKLPGSATIFPQWHPDTIAKRFRSHLRTALGEGARAQLFEASAHQRQIEYHDLRASFITFALANGRSDEWIRERSGHTTSQMIARYRRPRVAKLALKDWLPLDQALGLAAPSEVEHGGDRAAVIAGGNQAPQLAGELALARLDGELEQAAQVGGRELGLAHESHPAPPGSAPAETLHLPPATAAGNPAIVTPDRVAMGVATWNLADDSTNERSSMIHPVSESAPGWTRTTDQRIRNQPFCDPSAHEHDTTVRSCARTNVKAPDAAAGLPVSVLTESDYARLAELALAAREWELLSRVATDRAVIEAAQATRSNVTSLVVERRKRGSR